MKWNSFTLIAIKKNLERKIPLLCMLLMMALSMHAQDKGMHFEHGSSWKATLAKAMAEKKFIFVDCYTTWCGPCKYMSKNIFPKEEVGLFYNQHFINAKFQLDSTSKDAEDIQNQYADAAFIMKSYKIRAYPTYLFFNSEGELVHQELGSSEAAEFIAKGANAMNPEKQYFTQVKKYEAGNREPIFLKRLALIASDALDEAGASKYANDFLATKPDLQDKENIRFIYQTTSDINDTGFSMMISDPAKFENVIGKNNLHNSLVMMITRAQETKNARVFGKWDEQQWNDYTASLTKQYPAFADEILTRFKTRSFRDKKDWASYAVVVNKYSHSTSINYTELNDYAWTVFTKCDDKKILQSALEWSKLTFDKETKKEPGYIDTYANILYKLGKKEEALAWERKAQATAVEQGSDKNWGQDVIDKINKGEPTW